MRSKNQFGNLVFRTISSATRAALALVIVPTLAVCATRSAQAQTVSPAYSFMGSPQGVQAATSKLLVENKDDSDWPMYGHDPTRSFANPASGINPANVGRLTEEWNFSTGDAVTAQAVTHKGVVYAGSWDGYFYALDETTGAML